jgi:hypothetical protein
MVVNYQNGSGWLHHLSLASQRVAGIRAGPDVNGLDGEHMRAGAVTSSDDGAVSYQMLSGVAHALIHGLSHLLMISPAAQPGKVQVHMNVAPHVLARQLLVGPLCATTLVEHLRWFLGWDTEKIDPAANRMEATWDGSLMSSSWDQGNVPK